MGPWADPRDAGLIDGIFSATDPIISQSFMKTPLNLLEIYLSDLEYDT